jgi:hypothetical protein
MAIFLAKRHGSLKQTTKEEKMKRLSIGYVASLLLILSVLVSCSKDKPTENGPTPDPSFTALVGTWERTTTKADGVVITPENDQWGVYSEDTIILRADSTGLWSDEQETQQILNWYTDGAYIVIYADGEASGRHSYTLQDDTLSFFFPGSQQYNTPDLELIYTRM